MINEIESLLMAFGVVFPVLFIVSEVARHIGHRQNEQLVEQCEKSLDGWQREIDLNNRMMRNMRLARTDEIIDDVTQTLDEWRPDEGEAERQDAEAELTD